MISATAIAFIKRIREGNPTAITKTCGENLFKENPMGFPFLKACAYKLTGALNLTGCE